MTQRNVPRETDDPIAAIATASGKAGIGIIRVSGRFLTPLVESVVGRIPPARVATHARFNDAAGNPIDEGIALYFPAPHSYTGETVLELQGHGGPAVLHAVLRRCLELGCRLARPGEFTERAYLNGQLDLAEAEAVADLIEAGSEAAARSAARTLTGVFSSRIQGLVSGLIDLRMHVEACIDFPEEEIDLADRNKQELKLASLVDSLDELLKDARQGAVLRDGLTVVLIGRPNVGKSSLLNRLAGEDLAIVTPIAGTTRDQVRATVHLSGIPIHLIDTAGLRETDDPVEKIGIERTWQAIANAGAALLIVETGETARRTEAEILSRLSPELPIAWVANKIDLYQGSQVSRETRREGRNATLSVSALTGEGMDTLRDWLLEVAGWEPGSEGVFMARERHLVALRSASRHLEAAKPLGSRFDLFAEELRLGQQALQAITGEFTADDLLGEIFSRFCIGK